MASATALPCDVRTSTWRSLATISSGLWRFFRIAVPLLVRRHTSRWTNSVGVDQCVSSPVDVPVLKDSAPTRVGMDRAGIGMPSRYPPAMHLLLRARRSHRLLKNLIAVFWMHRNVAITVKNNGRDRRPVTQNYPFIRRATLSHSDKRRGKVTGDPTGEARMYADCCVQVAIRCSHDSGSGRSGREPANIDALWINRIVAHDLASDARDERRFTSAPLLVDCAKPVPAFRLVCLAGLCRIDHKASLFFCDNVHPRAGGEIVW